MVAENELWIQAPEAVRLFPTFVWKCRLRPEVHRPINAAILDLLHETRRGLPPLARGEAWQSGHGLHKQEELRGLVSCIDAAVDTTLAFLRVGHPQALITGCWANVNAPGAAHRMHAHPNNFLSGVYYVQVQDGAATDPERRRDHTAVTELTAYNTDQVVISVSPGTLIVFPPGCRTRWMATRASS